MVLGENFIVWILLALGAAMLVGNVMAIVKPRSPDVSTPAGDLAQAPRVRSAMFALLGFVVALAATAALIVR